MTKITFTITPIPPNVAMRPMSTLTALLSARTIAAKPTSAPWRRIVTARRAQTYGCAGRRAGAIVSGAPLWAVVGRGGGPGEVPERLNGRDWKSRNGG